jgi:hypothetical protein
MGTKTQYTSFDPMCKNGVVDSSFQVCCASSCERCGYRWQCTQLPSSEDDDNYLVESSSSSHHHHHELCCPEYLTRSAPLCATPLDVSCLLQKPDIEKCWEKASESRNAINMQQHEMSLVRSSTRHASSKGLGRRADKPNNDNDDNKDNAAASEPSNTHNNEQEGDNNHEDDDDEDHDNDKDGDSNNNDDDDTFYKSPLPVPEAYILNEGDELTPSPFTFDILQVVTKVDCIVSANANRIYSLYLRDNNRDGSSSSSSSSLGILRKHVIVTPDSHNCNSLGAQYQHTTAHVHCVRDDVFGSKFLFDHFERRFNTIGPISKYKGVRWYWNQLVMLYAVASGLNGVLLPRVKVLDAGTLILDKAQFFTSRGHEVFDYLLYPDDIFNDHKKSGFVRVNDDDHKQSSVDSTTDDDDDDGSFLKYGPLFYAATGKRLFGSHRAISYGMSMTKHRARKLLSALSGGIPGSIPGGGSGSKGVWTSLNWIHFLANNLCDAVSDHGFSAYWYYFSFTLLDEESLQKNRNDTIQHHHHRSEGSRRALTSARARWAKIVEKHNTAQSSQSDTSSTTTAPAENGFIATKEEEEEKKEYSSIVIRLASPSKLPFADGHRRNSPGTATWAARTGTVRNGSGGGGGGGRYDIEDIESGQQAGLQVQKLKKPWPSDTNIHDRDRCRWLQVVLQDIDYSGIESVAHGAFMVVFEELKLFELNKKVYE